MLSKTGNPECASSTALSFRFKRIKDYVYDMETVLGKGNFSTVYQAVREHTSTPPPMQISSTRSRWSSWPHSPSRSWRSCWSRRFRSSGRWTTPTSSAAPRSSRAPTTATSSLSSARAAICKKLSRSAARWPKKKSGRLLAKYTRASSTSPPRISSIATSSPPTSSSRTRSSKSQTSALPSSAGRNVTIK